MKLHIPGLGGDQQEQLYYLSNAIPQLVWIAGADGKVIFYNERVSEYAGATRLADGSWQWDGLLHPHDTAATVEAWAEAVRSGETYVKEHRVKMKNGTYRWHLSRGVPKKNDDGTVSVWFGTATDIHDQKTNEELIKLAQESAQMGSWHYDFQLETITASDQLKMLLGLDPTAEFSFELFISRVVEEDRENIVNVYRDLSLINPQHPRLEHEYRIRMDDQSIRWLKAKGRIFFNSAGKPIHFAGLMLDITHEKTVEEKLNYRKALLEAQSDAIPDALLVVDARGKILSFNKNFPLIWRIPEHIIAEKNDDLALAYVSKMVVDGDAFLTGVRKHYEHSRGSTREEIHLKDGRIIERYGNAVLGDDNTNYGWAWYFRDITREKNAERALEQLITDRTKELQRSNDDLLQFAHVASHDLKEPVRKIKTFASMLRTELGEVPSERGRLYMSKIESAADRMYHMIDGLLTYSSLGTVENLNEKVSLETVIENIKTDLELVFLEKKATLMHEELPVLKGSQVLIYQLFFNLINNSLKFSKRDVPCIIHIRTSAYPHQLGLDDRENFITIELKDNGVGFEDVHAENIFKTFTRLHPRKEYEGTGLGLALCKKIVERHGGQIRATAKVNDGASFTIVLPLFRE